MPRNQLGLGYTYSIVGQFHFTARVVVCLLQRQSRPHTVRSSHRPLQSSLSVPVETTYYQPDPSGAGPADAAFLSPRPPAPRLAERRTQSIGDSSTRVVDVAKLVPAAAPTRYKTELCRPFEENGACRYGNKCQFAHGKAELRSVVRHPKYKTDLCRTFHTTGLCPYGPRCHFIHNDDERRTDSESEHPLRLLTARGGLDQPDRGPARGLHRQYSDYRPRPDAAATTGASRPGGGASGDLQRRASDVADAVIRRSIVGGRYQHQLQTVVEAADPHHGLKINTGCMRSLGSVTDSYSSASSLTDSPSPSPTAGLLLSAAEEPVTPTPHARQVAPGAGGWAPEPEPARAALLAELVSRLGPQDIAAALIRALQQNGNAAPSTPSTTPTGFVPRGVDGKGVDTSTMRQMDAWAQCFQHQQQQQRTPAASNVCW